MTLHLPIMCSTRGLFAGCFLWATHEPVLISTYSTFEAWFFTDLSHLSLTNKPTYIQGKWLKKLQWNLAQNLSQHNIVGNYNFTYAHAYLYPKTLIQPFCFCVLNMLLFCLVFMPISLYLSCLFVVCPSHVRLRFLFLFFFEMLWTCIWYDHASMHKCSGAVK